MTKPDQLAHGTLTCPACGAQWRMAMPDNACVRFADCPACSARLAPLPGDCCVFCSWGDARCPPRLGEAGR